MGAERGPHSSDGDGFYSLGIDVSPALLVRADEVIE
jgi:hypothetical protein